MTYREWVKLMLYVLAACYGGPGFYLLLTGLAPLAGLITIGSAVFITIGASRL